jgi:hypothetical protein
MAGVSRAAAAALLIALAGCWRGGETDAEEPTSARAKGATCEEVGLNALEVLIHADDRQLAARAMPLRDLVQRRCTADGWSIELRRCVAAAKTLDDGNLCKQLATPQQQTAFQHDVEVTVVTDDSL